jgi:hypothetical protein
LQAWASTIAPSCWSRCSLNCRRADDAKAVKAAAVPRS